MSKLIPTYDPYADNPSTPITEIPKARRVVAEYAGVWYVVIRAPDTTGYTRYRLKNIGQPAIAPPNVLRGPFNSTETLAREVIKHGGKVYILPHDIDLSPLVPKP